MATVYLALQESVQREVALKVMSPTLHGDAEFSERFLREARIAASLRHRHVVQVHDVGRAADWHFIAMEHLAGGPVLDANMASRQLEFCLRITREIALALNYAHERGVIHRDIKPDNIMLRDDGAAVLTDFGIARAKDSKRMTMTGTVLGTPHYMSPEQASGRPLDGRADLYSLGIVFHELAVGQVPFDAEDWVSVGMMHLSAPLPVLPPRFHAIQPLINGLLAKDPDQRFQTGVELAEAIEDVEASLIADATRGKRRSAPTGVIPSPETIAPPVPAVKSVDDAEPMLGDLAQLLGSPSPRARRRSQRGQATATSPRWLRYAVPVLLFCLIAAGYHYRGPLRDLVSPSRNEELLQQAQAALAAGHLSGADPAGARELFQTVIALDPDSARARAGLSQVAEALLEQARTASAEGRVEDARRDLQRARDAGAAALDVEAIETTIRGRLDRDDELADVVQRAQRALAENRLDRAEDSALALYTQALAIAPDSAVAQAGQRDTLSAILKRAEGLIEAGEYAEASLQIDVVGSIDPRHLELPDVRSRLASARESRQSDLERLIDEGNALRLQGRLTSPSGGSARDRYRLALESDPESRAARDGLRQIALALLRQADRKMADFEFVEAAELIDSAVATDREVPGRRATEAKLRELQEKRGSFARGAALSPAQQAALDSGLAAAAKAQAEGDLVYPPGESAWDLYRRALSIQPDNEAARAGLAQLPAEARRRFEQSMGSSRLSSARGYLEGLQTLAPTDSALPDMKRRLAAALLGYANERLGAGEFNRAAEALTQAGELDPTHPDLASLRARLDQARE